MSFPLRRLQLLAIRELIKSMNTGEILFLSVLSKKSANFVMLSIPKNSLSADFTFTAAGFLFELMPKGFNKQAAEIVPVLPTLIENHSLFTKFSTCGHYVHWEWVYFFEVEVSIAKQFFYFSKIFKNSKIHMKFEDGTREEFAMEMLRFAWENGFPLDRVNFSLDNASPESIQKLLNGCNEHHTSLRIGTKLPEDFKCTPPPGGYKFKSLSVDHAHWVNLDDFLQCRKVIFTTGFPDLTPEYLRGLLKKIANMECRLESFLFQLKSIKPIDFGEIVRGVEIVDGAYSQGIGWQRLEFKRKDGLKLAISLSNGYLDLENDVL